MYFLFSKLLIYFLYPLNWILLLLIAAIFIKNIRYKRRAGITALIIFLLFSNGFLLNKVASAWDILPTALPKKTYSCALVLGGYISEYNKTTGFFNGAADRFIQAIKLKESGTATHLLFTGGNASIAPDGFVEGNWLQQELQPYHFADSTLLFETQSRNTIENIRFSEAILQAKRLPPPYLLVTSAFHMRRALLICRKAGLPVVAFACQLSPAENQVSFDQIFPSAETLGGWNAYIKEFVGYVVTSFKH